MAIPKHANVMIKIGSKIISVSHNFVSRIEIKRVVSDAANKFTVNILDNPAFEIERALLAGSNEIEFSYFDNDNNAKEYFAGNITKMSSSFYNNRNMLTIEGYVGLSIKDKYKLRTRNWNKIVLFPWDQVFDGWKGEDAGDGDMRTWWQKFKDDFAMVFGSAFGAPHSDEGKADTNDEYVKKVKELIDKDLIYTDDDGNFYVYSQKEEDTSDTIIKGTVLSLPVKPSEILKLMCTGGKLTDLLPKSDDIENYSGTEFYNTLANRKSILVDLAFIRHFLDKHSKVEPNGWKVGKIEDTVLVQADFSQVAISDIKYTFDVLSKYAIQEVKSGNKKEYLYSFKFNMNDDKTVDFAPIEVKANAEPVQTYYYYSSGENSNKNTVLKTFSANTDILTAYLTGDETSLSSLSNLNLITGEPQDTSVLPVDDDVEEAKYKYSYESVDFAPIVVSSSVEGAKATWEDYWKDARIQTYKADAVVTGYSGTKPGDYVEIIVMPSNVQMSDGTSKVLYHHSSGLYYITSQTDIIENGTYSSKLELVKNIASLGKSTYEYKKSTDKTLDDYDPLGGKSLLQWQVENFNKTQF